jgi:hypothetical protein
MTGLLDGKNRGCGIARSPASRNRQRSFVTWKPRLLPTVPDSVQRYLEDKFGESLKAVRLVMQKLQTPSRRQLRLARVMDIIVV